MAWLSFLTALFIKRFDCWYTILIEAAPPNAKPNLFFTEPEPQPPQEQQRNHAKRKESEGEVDLFVIFNESLKSKQSKNSDVLIRIYCNQVVDVMSVTPRSSWPAEGMNQAGAHQTSNRQFNMNNNPAARLNNSGVTPQQQQQHLHQQQQQDLASQLHSQTQGTLKPMMQQQQQQPPPQHRQSSGPTPLFNPPTASSVMNLASDVHLQQQQQNMFVNGQSDMNHAPQPFAAPTATSVHNMAIHSNNGIKTDGQSMGQYLNVAGDFNQRMDSNVSMVEFEHEQKKQQHQDLNDMSGSDMFNAMQQQQGMTMNEKGQVPPLLGPSMSLPVSGGKPKSHSAAMAQVRNASSWSSLAGSSQQGPGGSSKATALVDSFQQFKRQAKEKEARQKALLEQQEMRRQQKEQAERERMRAETDRRRERDEEEALEKAR